MTSGPLPDWIEEVVRAWMSLALIISMLSLSPSAFSQAGAISLRSTSPEAGTKSFQRSQCSVVPCAKAGARPDARIAASPPEALPTVAAPETFRNERRVMRSMAFLLMTVGACVLRHLARLAWVIVARPSGVDLRDLVMRPLDRLLR